jgi:hypothetical protein
VRDSPSRMPFANNGNPQCRSGVAIDTMSDDKFICMRMPIARHIGVIRRYHNILFMWATTTWKILLLVAGCLSSAQAVTSVTLAWDANTDTDVAGYRVHYGTAPGNYAYILDVGNNTSAVLPNLYDGTTYFFVVTAYNSTLESQPSNEITFTSPGAPPKVAVSSMARVSGGTVQLSLAASGWAGPSGGVHVYYSNDLVTWTWLKDVNLTAGTAVISDPGASTANRRFYRLSYVIQ